MKNDQYVVIMLNDKLCRAPPLAVIHKLNMVIDVFKYFLVIYIYTISIFDSK